jgi:hypothetical protein
MSLYLASIAAVSPVWAERVETVLDLKLDTPAAEGAWTFKGDCAWRDGALCTNTRQGADHAVATFNTTVAIPDAAEGACLRAEWTMVPVQAGGWGQDFSMGDGPIVVEHGQDTPILNAHIGAHSKVRIGEVNTQSLDFNRYRVFSWKINGEEQLDAPAPAWHPDREQGKFGFADYKETKSETRWLALRVSKIYPDDPLPMYVSGWDTEPAIAPDKPSAFLLGAANAMVKVFREAGDYSAGLERRVRIAAAGRERESFQVVCIPLGAALKNTSVECTDLLHTDFKGRIPAAQIAWRPVGYVRTAPSNSSIRRTGWEWPDILLPAKPFDVEPGFVQPVWFTVDVPADTPAGDYRGVITVRADGVEPQQVKLQVTVRGFSLPVRGKLKTAFCMSPGIWEMWYYPDEVKKRLGMTDATGHGPLYTSNELADVLPQGKWREIYDFLLAHRLSPTAIYSGLRNGRARTVPAREDMAYCYEHGMNATCLANVDVLPPDPAAADKYLADIEAYLRDWEGFVKEKNWPDFTWYVHGFDESEMRPNPTETVDPSIHRLNGLLGEKFPWLKRETANPFTAKHVGFFDIWTPLTAQLSGDLTEYRKRQTAGDEAWAYVCCAPGKPYANFFLDFPGVDPRILGWQFYQYKLTGFLYYLIDFYEPEKNWNMNAPKWPETPWNPFSFNTNSDGILIYPGPDATPLASTRLENIRDGIEDYEALAMLAELTERLEKQGGQDELVAKARDVLAVRPEVSKSWTEYTQEPARILAARAEVDGLIEVALAALK